MFKTLVYFDRDRVMQYSSLLKNERTMQLKNVKISDRKKLGGKVPVLQGEVDKIEEYEGEIIENDLLDCDEFENLLAKRSEDDYFDFTETDYDFETLPKASIIKFECGIVIPDSFDIMSMINDFRPQIIASINETENSEMLSAILGKKTTKIPMFFEIDGFKLGFSKINSNNLCIDIESIEAGDYDNVIVIAKFKARKKVVGQEIIFDVMKDLFSMNRALRKQFGNKGVDGIENITVDEDYYSLEVLAIYQ